MPKPKRPIQPIHDDDDDAPMSKVRSRSNRLTDDDVALLAAKIKTGEVLLSREQIEARYRRAELTMGQQTELVIALQIALAAPHLDAAQLPELERYLRSLPAMNPELSEQDD